MKKVLMTVAALALVAGCQRGSTMATSFNQEAGSSLSTGDFGNSTMNNTLVQTGQASYAINLNRRFSAEVQTTINFAFGSYVLDGDAKATLRQQADWIKQFPEVRFKVFGHTDLVGGNASNQRLGLRRAEAAVLYLVSQGISRSRLEAVVSFGETQPLIVTEGQERANRRTVTEVTGFVQGDSRVLDGQYAAIIFREYVASATAPTGLTGGGIAPSGG